MLKHEYFLKRINIDEGKYTKLYQKHIPNSMEQNYFALMIDLLYELKYVQVIIALINLLNGSLCNMKKIIK